MEDLLLAAGYVGGFSVTLVVTELTLNILGRVIPALGNFLKG